MTANAWWGRDRLLAQAFRRQKSGEQRKYGGEYEAEWCVLELVVGKVAFFVFYLSIRM